MRKPNRKYYFFAMLTSVFISSLSFAHTNPDPVLAQQIAELKIIDSHCHILTIPYQEISDNILGAHPFDHPVFLRVKNPQWIGAWRYLWGYQYDDMKMEHLKIVINKKQQLRREKGKEYPSWILDKMGVEAALVNMPMLGPGQASPRFYQYPYVDSLLNPFVNFNMWDPEDFLYGKKKGIKPAADLEEYIKSIVTPTIQSHKKKGMVAVKFIAAYFRPIKFNRVSKEDASHVYGQLLEGRNVSATEQRKLEDYLFRYICKEAGRFGLPIAIHTGVGANPHFNLSGSNPLLLESVLDDPEQQNSIFVLIHGGWPFEKEAGLMLLKPNVYLDFSDTTFLRSTRAVSRALRDWLEWFPEKVMFGSDAYPDPNTPLADWEEKLWLTTKSARNALAIALTEMMNDGQITYGRALEIARMVLRETAIKVYGLEISN